MVRRPRPSLLRPRRTVPRAPGPPIPPPSGRLSPELPVNLCPEPSPTIFGELLGHFSSRGEFLRKVFRLREYHVAFVLYPIFPIYPVILSIPRLSILSLLTADMLQKLQQYVADKDREGTENQARRSETMALVRELIARGEMPKELAKVVAATAKVCGW